MKRNRTVWGLVSLVVLTTIAVTVGTMNSHSQQATTSPTPSEGKDSGDKKTLFPTVDFAGAVPDADSEERKARGVYFNKSYVEQITEDRRIRFITYSTSSVDRLWPIPIKQSSLILTGIVTNLRAFLSKNKTSVYSEFSLKVEKLIRTDNGLAVTPDDIIVLNRMGGQVRFPSGHIQSYEMSGAGALEVGGEYIVFVRREESLRGFLLVTAYKIENGKIFPVDDTKGVAAYKEMPLSEFLKEIEKVLGASQSEEEPSL